MTLKKSLTRRKKEMNEIIELVFGKDVVIYED
jgi:hypothetical protein